MVVRQSDVVLLLDPQTAGLVDGVRELGAHVVWRCHIGRDEPNSATDQGWDFLRGYLRFADAFVFSRDRYIPEWLPPNRVRVIHRPSTRSRARTRNWTTPMSWACDAEWG